MRMGVIGNWNNQWEWEENGNKTWLNLGLGMEMGMSDWEWGMGLKKTFSLISTTDHASFNNRYNLSVVTLGAPARTALP